MKRILLLVFIYCGWTSAFGQGELLSDIGTNFDFLQSNISFNQMYGSVHYKNDSALKFRNKSCFGFDIGGYNSKTITSETNVPYGHKGFIDPLNPVLDASNFRGISQTIRAKQSNSFRQLGLYINPSFNVYAQEKLKLGIGVYTEMYRVTSSITYSDTALLKSDTFAIPKTSRFVPTYFGDSIGHTSTYGNFGFSFALGLNTKVAEANLRVVLGKMIQGIGANSEYNRTVDFFGLDSKYFYLIEASIREPKNKIAIHGNIRGLLPNGIPVVGVYATKTFDISKLYDAVVK